MVHLPLLVVFLIWVIGFGSLFLAIKEKVAKIFLKNKLPRWINYLLIPIVPILIEESLTCESSFPYFVSVILPAFLLFFLILYFFQKTFKLSWRQGIIVFGILGTFNEFFVVGRVYLLLSMPVILAIMIVICFCIYAVLAILPSYYYERTLKAVNQK